LKDFFQHFIHEFALPLQNPVLVFSLILLIILLSPILLRKLNIPSIIGLILSGLIVGPHGFNMIENNKAIELFSTIGLLYIMFIAGLELDLNEFKKYRNKSLTFGFLTFFLPIIVGFPVCYYILGYSFSASLLVASMFATHTLVAYPIVSKFGISKDQAVAITVGGTILTDTAVLIVLAVIIGSVNQGLTSEFWVRMIVSIIIFSFIMFFIIPRIAKWFFNKLESEKHSHYIFVLSVVFFSAFLAEVAGLEPIIGAFVAGLAINKLIPHSSVLMNRIDFIGNSLFIPFFLISVGMIIDMSVIMKGPQALIVAGTLTLVAISGKWLAAFFTQIIFKYTKLQRQLIFGLSSAHAAATLAVIMVGFRVKLLDENILNGTIILILVTCIVASITTENVAKKIIILEDTNLDNELDFDESKEHILLPIANINNMDKLLNFCVLIKSKKSNIPITILTVVQNNEAAEKNIMTAKNKLSVYLSQTSAAESSVNVIATIDHNIAGGISRTSKEIMADIIVLGWPQKQNFVDKLLGQKAESILKNTDKTTIISNFEYSLEVHNRMVLVCPKFVEHEKGFVIWLMMIAKLANELSLSVICHCTEKTKEAILSTVKNYKLNFELEFILFHHFTQFFESTPKLKSSDLFVFISARNGSLSYQTNFDDVPELLEEKFDKNSKLIIYPQQKNHESKEVF
jgi:Kef-type K+ transport system membrane component KefB